MMGQALVEGDEMGWSEGQTRLIEHGRGGLWVRGVAGAGKTTAAVERVRRLLGRGVAGHTVMICTPQRLLSRPYRGFVGGAERVMGSDPQFMTFGRLTQYGVGLYWPWVAEAAGLPTGVQPTFLDAESAQWLMGLVVAPQMAQAGIFQTVKLPRARIYGQVLDNMNKAALVGFDVHTIGERLSRAWSGEVSQLRMYEDVQTAADLFRAYCLETGALDYSLTVELFLRHVWPLPAARAHFEAMARHMIYDNCEEDAPAAHHVFAELVGTCESAVVMLDDEANYRRFLGADEQSAAGVLAEACDESLVLEPYGDVEARRALVGHFAVSFGFERGELPEADPFVGVERLSARLFPNMLDRVAERVAAWVKDDGVPVNEIALVSPYVSDGLLFAMRYRLERMGIETRSLRPSRMLRQEPVVRCLVTLAYLAHPAWGIVPTVEDIGHVLVTVIEGLDPVRAALLASVSRKRFSPFETLVAAMQERVTLALGERYERLRRWVEAYQQGEPIALDHFFSRVYAEVLSRRGFRMHGDFEMAQAVAALVDSAASYRLMMAALPMEVDSAVLYLEGLSSGLLGQRSLSEPDVLEGAGVLIAPAYTFLMANQFVTHQVWLDAGSGGWTERLAQPLAHPYVLSAQWEDGRVWTGIDEGLSAAQGAYRLIAGLLRRCRGTVVLASSEYGEQGMPQQGVLLNAFGRIVRRVAKREGRKTDGV